MSSWRDRAIPVKAASTSDWRSRAKPVAVAAPAEEEVQQEMPDWLAKSDRFIVKNFANSPEVGVKYLQQQYPSGQFRVVNGQIQAKDYSEKGWKVLDPDTPLMSMATLKDLPNDIADMGYDAVSGLAQGAATTAGATAGALGGPAGAMGGGMAASGASGGGLEYLRQKLGQALGIPQDVDGSKIAMNAATSAAMPLAFGTGKLAAPVVAEYAARNGLTAEAAQKALQSGAISRTWNAGASAVGPKLGELASGIKAPIIRAYAANQDKIDGLKQSGIIPYAEGVAQKVNTYLQAGKKSAGEQLQAALEAAKSPVDIAAAKHAFQDRLAVLENKPDITNAEQAEIDSLKGMYTKYFGMVQPGEFGQAVDLPDQVNASRAFDLQQKLKKAAAWEQNMTPETQSAKGSARGAYLAINDGLSDASGGATQDAKDAYSKMIGIENDLEPKFEDGQKTYANMVGLDKTSKTALRERLNSLAKNGELDVGNDIDTMQAYHAFEDANPNVGRKAPLAALGGTIGSLLGYHAGGGYPGAAMGGAAGMGIGATLGSREMIKNVIRANAGIGKSLGSDAVQSLSPYLQGEATQNVLPWWQQSSGQP